MVHFELDLFPAPKLDGRGASASKVVSSYRVNAQRILAVRQDDSDDETVL